MHGTLNLCPSCEKSCVSMCQWGSTHFRTQNHYRMHPCILSWRGLRFPLCHRAIQMTTEQFQVTLSSRHFALMFISCTTWDCHTHIVQWQELQWFPRPKQVGQLNVILRSYAKGGDWYLGFTYTFTGTFRRVLWSYESYHTNPVYIVDVCFDWLDCQEHLRLLIWDCFPFAFFICTLLMV